MHTVVDGERVEVDPLGVDWQSVSRARFPYLVRQDAGAANALGRIKFIMPNSEDIFMHDTPERHLFSRPERAFSSGCIRLERPLDLLDVVLEGTAGWDRARATSVLDGRATASVSSRADVAGAVALHHGGGGRDRGAGPARHLRARRGLCPSDGRAGGVGGGAPPLGGGDGAGPRRGHALRCGGNHSPAPAAAMAAAETATFGSAGARLSARNSG